MTPESQELAGLLAGLEHRYGDQLEVLRSTPEGFTVRFGDGDHGIVGVAVDDPGRPSFRVSYSELRIRRNRDRVICEVHSGGVLAAGVEWLMKKVARHGYLPPEIQD